MPAARDLLFWGLCLVGLLTAGTFLFRPQSAPLLATGNVAPPAAPFLATVKQVNAEFRQHWQAQHLAPLPRANDLLIARRLSLALAGTVPSLAEIRQFEQLPVEVRLAAWTESLLADRRTSEYLAERFARQFVGVEDGPFLLYRRRRFVTWLADRLHENHRLDDLCRQMIAAEGLWTDHPATNFITVSLVPGQGNRPDVDKLAGRVSRSMLGLQLDCAQCHDHPFDARWKQTDFQHLASFFSETATGLTGIQDQPQSEQEQAKEPAEQPDKLAMAEWKADLSPEVPFAEQLLPGTGSQRERLAVWVTHPQNRNFARAQVNRVWGLMFGRPLIEPIDDIPLTGPFPPGMETLAEAFTNSGYDLRYLVRLIAATEVFQLDSASPLAATLASVSPEQTEHWAVFPLTRLRPEQVAGSLLQASSLTTINHDSQILVRLTRATGERDFLRQYGDAGSDELSATGGTIPQRLVLLNGELVADKIRDNLLLNAATQIAALAPTDQSAVETAYLTVFTRRPETEEATHFTQRLLGTTKETRRTQVADLYWALFNSTEFAWNH